MTFGERLKAIRKEHKMTQQTFAAEFGISQTHVSKLEKEVESPSDTLLKFISYRFAINYEWLKNGTGEKELSNGGSKDERINQYFICRERYERLFDNFNTARAFPYVGAYMGFVNCITLIKNMPAFKNQIGMDHTVERFLETISIIQTDLFFIADTFYGDGYEKGGSNKLAIVREAKREKCLSLKKNIDLCIDQIISEGLDER